MFSQKLVSDLMDASVVPLQESVSLEVAVAHLVDSIYSGLPVVDGHGKISGFLSEHDCLRYLISSSYYLDDRVCVSDIMYRQPLTVSPKETLMQLAERMEGGKPKVYPVCDEGKLLGVVTRKEAMRALNNTLVNTKKSA
jgi:CBS domain-containing protein